MKSVQPRYFLSQNIAGDKRYCRYLRSKLTFVHSEALHHWSRGWYASARRKNSFRQNTDLYLKLHRPKCKHLALTTGSLS